MNTAKLVQEIMVRGGRHREAGRQVGRAESEREREERRCGSQAEMGEVRLGEAVLRREDGCWGLTWRVRERQGREDAEEREEGKAVGSYWGGSTHWTLLASHNFRSARTSCSPHPLFASHFFTPFLSPRAHSLLGKRG